MLGLQASITRISEEVSTTPGLGIVQLSGKCFLPTNPHYPSSKKELSVLPRDSFILGKAAYAIVTVVCVLSTALLCLLFLHCSLVSHRYPEGLEFQGLMFRKL